MIREDLVAEGIAIDSGRRMIAYLAARDQEILAKEEEHAEDRASLLRSPSLAARGARF